MVLETGFGACTAAPDSNTNSGFFVYPENCGAASRTGR
jgi:hypothetical protein